VGQGLDKNVDDFRNKKLFDFGFDEPSKVEIHDGAKSYFLTKSGQDWWSADGKKLDATSAQSLIDKIRELSASKFVDSGFTTPVMEVIVTSNDSKRIEKVLISKSGENYAAKRENEPALYQLDSASVTDLQKLANDVKPAPAAGKK
jgi:predicted patatin/cPLA2 family phospholipase